MFNNKHKTKEQTNTNWNTIYTKIQYGDRLNNQLLNNGSSKKQRNKNKKITLKRDRSTENLRKEPSLYFFPEAKEGRGLMHFHRKGILQHGGHHWEGPVKLLQPHPSFSTYFPTTSIVAITFCPTHMVVVQNFTEE